MVGKDKTRFCISLNKEIIKSMDLIVATLNKQIKKGEKQFTRSMLINDALCMLFETGAKLRVQKTTGSKGGKKDA